MRRSLLIIAACCCALSWSPAQEAPQGPSAAELKMREEVKNSRLKIATLENERNIAVAEKQTLEAELKKFKSDLEKRVKEEDAAKKEMTEKMEGLNAKLGDTEKNLAQHQEALKKWKESHAKVVSIANTTEGKRSQLASQTVVMQRRIDEQQAKNYEMYKLAAEILERYEKFGLGTALLAREPFIGNAKVKLKTWVQDFADKINDAQIGPSQTPGATAPVKTIPDKATAPSKKQTTAAAQPEKKAKP